MQYVVLVRDKSGLPKFNKPEQIKHFSHMLTQEDLVYLHGKYGENFVYKDGPTWRIKNG